MFSQIYCRILGQLSFCGCRFIVPSDVREFGPPMMRPAAALLGTALAVVVGLCPRRPEQRRRPSKSRCGRRGQRTILSSNFCPSLALLRVPDRCSPCKIESILSSPRETATLDQPSNFFPLVDLLTSPSVFPRPLPTLTPEAIHQAATHAAQSSGFFLEPDS